MERKYAGVSEMSKLGAAKEREVVPLRVQK
jgi:hypothetical protein